MMFRHGPWIAFGASAVLLAGLLALWAVPTDEADVPNRPRGERPAIVVYTAAALRPPVEKAAAAFEEECGCTVELRFGASEELLTKLKVTRQGDLFLPADDSYVAEARQLGLVEQDYPLARLTAVAVLRADFPKPSQDVTWDDLFRPGFRLAQPNPDAAAIGKLTRQGLTEAGLWERIERSRAVSVGTVTEAANAVSLGSADGAIIWDSVAARYPALKVVQLPHLDRVTANVTAAVCRGAESRAEARRFAEYLAGQGQTHFRAAGYAPAHEPPRSKAPGPRRGETTEVVLYAGAMLRPAIEETVQEFERREHVRVTRVYNGCGILVGQMRAGGRPDVYFACDPRFMGDVADLFERPDVVSNNRLVIAVARGNPHGITGLRDLGKDGLRVGVGHEQQCALGAITKETFLRAGVYASVCKNVLVESPTGDLLVNQILTGSLDAVVCYVSNVTPNADKLDAVPVTGIPCATPEQPIAVAKASASPELAARLIEYLRAPGSRARFERLGFGWGRREPPK
jgi:molybdenum ABC transporter molybdate-binding protein